MWKNKSCYNCWLMIKIKVITKLPNSEPSYIFTVHRNLIILQIYKILKIICFFFQIQILKINKDTLPLKSSSMAIRSLSKVFTWEPVVWEHDINYPSCMLQHFLWAHNRSVVVVWFTKCIINVQILFNGNQIFI
jgi:hypothetical protein